MLFLRWKPVPRLATVGIESFFKNNPHSTLHVFSDSPSLPLHPKLSEQFKLRIIKVNLAQIKAELIRTLPGIEEEVFQHAAWQELEEAMIANDQLLSDFLKVAVIFLHGGSWFDVESLVLRSFDLRNSIGGIATDPYENLVASVQCLNGVPNAPYDPKAKFDAKNDFFLSNALLGGFQPKHPFLRAALFRLIRSYKRVPAIVLPHALNTFLFDDLLMSTHVIPSQPVHNDEVALAEWPNVLPIERLLGHANIREGLEGARGFDEDSIRTVSFSSSFSTPHPPSWTFDRFLILLLCLTEERAPFTIYFGHSKSEIVVPTTPPPSHTVSTKASKYSGHNLVLKDTKVKKNTKRLFGPNSPLTNIWKKNCLFTCEESLGDA